MIEDLPRLTPDASRSANTIARCHDRLAARRRRAERDKANIDARNRPRAGALASERWLVVGFCFVYLLAMAGDLLAIAIAAQR